VSDTTIRSVYFASKLARAVCDSLNLESGRIYRKKGIWLSGGTQERYNDFLNADSPKLLHAHSIDAAQQGFAKACKTAKANRGEGANYPHKRKHFRATVWKGRNGTQDGKILTSIRRAGEKRLSLNCPNRCARCPLRLSAKCGGSTTNPADLKHAHRCNRSW